MEHYEEIHGREHDSALAVNKGIEQPPIVNPHFRKVRRQRMTTDQYMEGIRSGNITVLSQAITLVESLLPEHYAQAQEIIERCLPYSGGSVRIGGRELSELSPREAASTVGYLGHDPELWNDTVEENVLCGEAGDAMRFLALTALDGEVQAMEQGLQTVVGSGGVRLSGGQAQRLALARTLAHPRPVLVLDDPFSALDRRTEDEVFARLKACAQDRVVILISHRLYHFPELRQIVFMQGGKADVGTHEALCASVPAYRALYESQTGGAAHEA